MGQVRTIIPNEISQGQLHSYLLNAIVPRPICFASTIDKSGNVNLSPFSYFNVFSSNPPVMIFSPARRGKDNTTKHTYENVLEVPEVTINLVSYSMVEQMSLASTEYEKGVNEFSKAGFSEIESTMVKPPRVGESPVAFECRIKDVISLGEIPGAGNLVIAEVLMIHIDEKYLSEQGKLDSAKLDLVARMGGNLYARMIPESLFEIPKPLAGKGLGVDKLPDQIRNSTILSGNNLGRLGNIERLPTEAEINSVRSDPEIIRLKSTLNPNFEYPEAIHLLAKNWIEKGEADKALALLMVLE